MLSDQKCNVNVIMDSPWYISICLNAWPTIMEEIVGISDAIYYNYPLAYH